MWLVYDQKLFSDYKECVTFGNSAQLDSSNIYSSDRRLLKRILKLMQLSM